MLRACHDPPARLRAQQVEPGDAVRPPGRLERRERIIHRADPVCVDRQRRPPNWHEPDPGVDDDAGQAHAPERRLERTVDRTRLELDEFAIGPEQRDRLDVRSERPRRAVVLAVDVARDGPADGHMLCAWHDRDHPAGGSDHAQELADCDAGLRGDRPAVVVELDSLQRGGLDHETTGDLRGVTVAASHAAR